MRSLSSSVLSTSKRNTGRVIVTSSFPAGGDWLVPAADLGRERRRPPAGPTCRARTRAPASRRPAPDRRSPTPPRRRPGGRTASRRPPSRRPAAARRRSSSSAVSWWTTRARAARRPSAHPGRFTRAPIAMINVRAAAGSGGSCRSSPADIVERERRALQRHHHLGRGDRQALAGADEERHAVPAPRVDVQPHRGERLDRRVGRDALLACGSRGTARAPRRSGLSGRIVRNTFTFSSRIDS